MFCFGFEGQKYIVCGGQKHAFQYELRLLGIVIASNDNDGFIPTMKTFW